MRLYVGSQVSVLRFDDDDVSNFPLVFSVLGVCERDPLRTT